MADLESGLLSDDRYYLKSSKTITKNLKELSNASGNLERINERIGPNPADSELEKRMQKLIRQGKRNLQAIKKEFENFNRFYAADSPVSESEKRKRKQEASKLKKQFQKTGKKFQIVSNAVAKHDAEEIRFERKSIGDESEFKILTEDQLRQQEAKINMKVLEDREHQIKGINREMADVNTIFKDLADMVDNADDNIENIEFQVGSSLVKAKSGVEQIEKAIHYQKKSRGSLYCLIVIFICIALGACLYALM
eukprot:TRINITY_DN28779_c0_g1_i1.p1 TRINITY_DN28779_c0_g1~~TRINITY_DN28779_c0_g1_i1.p1  ORF type:complete len:252 (-),score=82.73 TRINITY_DN28779_c0_g1_i1:593-1348(-)